MVAVLRDRVPAENEQTSRYIGMYERQGRSLARHGRADGVTVLGRMLDRTHVERNVTRTPAIDAELDPVAEVMVSGLQAVGALQAAELRDEVTELSRSDASLRVREVALRTLERLGPATAGSSAARIH